MPDIIAPFPQIANDVFDPILKVPIVLEKSGIRIDLAVKALADDQLAVAAFRLG